MNSTIPERPPTWFRIVSVLALLWNLFGMWQYLSYVGVVPMLSEMNADEAAIIARAPAWYTAAFAIAVFAGVFGALGLVLGRAWSRSLLMLSLVAAIVQFTWWCFMSGGAETMGPSFYVAPAVVILVAVLLVWLARTGINRRWLV
jgi:hypothetical protein